MAWAKWFVMSSGSSEDSDALRAESASRGEQEGETRGRLCVSSATQLMAMVFTFTRTLSCREKASDVDWSSGGVTISSEMMEESVGECVFLSWLISRTGKN